MANEAVVAGMLEALEQAGEQHNIGRRGCGSY